MFAKRALGMTSGLAASGPRKNTQKHMKTATTKMYSAQKHTKTRVFRLEAISASKAPETHKHVKTHKNTCVSLHGAATGCPWGSLWGTSGVSLVALGPLGLPGAARGHPKTLKSKKHMFLCVFVHVSKNYCFCIFLESAKSPRNETHMFLCVSVFLRISKLLC